MIAYVTSIGEPTTELCVWSLKRNGFTVKLIKSHTTLWDKLNNIYHTAEGDFLRVDADVIVNKNMTPEILTLLSYTDVWWWQFRTFDWFQQDLNHTMSFIQEEAIPSLRANIGRFERSLRPETDASRIEELHNPRRLDTYEDKIMGLHGYANDLESARVLKTARNQIGQYDFELAERLNLL